MYELFSVTSFHCNIFVKLSVFYICTLQTSVSYFYSLMPTMRDMYYSKGTKREITHIEYWRKTYMEATCYTATTTKIFITFSIEGKVCIISVEIQQPVVTIE